MFSYHFFFQTNDLGDHQSSIFGPPLNLKQREFSGTFPYAQYSEETPYPRKSYNPPRVMKNKIPEGKR
jgi:hypothetical protein